MTFSVQDNGLQKGKGKRKNTNWKWKGESVEEVKEMLHLGIKMQPNESNVRKNVKGKCGDETSVGNRKKIVRRRLPKVDDAVRPSGCGSHVVRGGTFRL